MLSVAAISIARGSGASGRFTSFRSEISGWVIPEAKAASAKALKLSGAQSGFSPIPRDPAASPGWCSS